MKWKKIGKIFAPSTNYSWMISHASNPTAEHLHDDVFRIYFSCRDNKNRSHIGFADIDITSPSKILKLSNKPILGPGDRGAFDDSGVSIACIKTVASKKFLYYLGWNLGVTVPWRNTIGLAIYNKKTQEFERFSKAPIVDRNTVDPFSTSYPFVIYDNRRYKMWYGSHLRWGTKPKDMYHVIKYAESQDGISWVRKNIIALNFKSSHEYAISRPCVIKEKKLYKMWYSYRGTTYRIGYAESQDGISWTRKDEKVGINVSKSGWDSEMIEYPFVLDHKEKRYMLYNGNGYGKTGFGLAILEM